jgi:membrane associated rhomboid family serine protease
VLIPVGIEHPYQRTPWVTRALIAACVVLWIAKVALPKGALDGLILQADDFSPHQLVTSSFMHAGLLHLAGNMLYLWVFGDYVEERLGPWRYLALYGACAVVGDLAWLASVPAREGLAGLDVLVPRRALGASGAISGLMGFTLVVAPWAQVRTYFLLHVKVSEPLLFGVFWIVGWGLLLDVVSMQWARLSGIAVLAHLGGAAAGATVGALLRHPRMKGSPWYVDPAPPGGGEEAVRRLSRARGGAARRTTSADPAIRLRLEHVPASISRVALVKLLMAHAHLEPDDAMDVVGTVTAGTPTAVAFPDRAAADAFAAEARALEVQVGAPSPDVRA